MFGKSSSNRRIGLTAITIGLGLMLMGSPGVHAATKYQDLHRFNKSKRLVGALTLDSAGSLYGTMGVGGVRHGGFVFELSPNGSGGWTKKVLYSFKQNGINGSNPYGK